MRSVKLLLLVLLALSIVVLAGCGGGGGGGAATPPVLVSIIVSPASQTVAAGTVVQYIANGTYSNGATFDVTASATWSSSNPAAASVSDAAGSKGSATAIAAGTTTITATVGSVSGASTLTVTGSGGSVGANVMTVSVNGSLCSPATSAGYFNKPCVSVTVCTPGTTNCQTINDILLDTGSYGLRIFKSALSSSMTFPQVTSGTGSLAGCIQFADGSSLWGPIQRATVKLGGEQGVDVPIQIVDSGFASTAGTNCFVHSLIPYVGPDRTPVEAGFTGILGVGLFAEDCGATCVASASNGIYYSCIGSTCTGTNVPLASQVQNPVAHLPQNNNGVIVQLPAVPLGGVTSISGSLIFGVGTASNNSMAAQNVFITDSSGDFKTIFFGTTFNESFLDTGSNANFIPFTPAAQLPTCSSPNEEWYCPPITRALLADLQGAPGAPTHREAFNVGNFLALFATGRQVFSEVAGTSSFGFDWGMPFHYGKTIMYGIEGRRANSIGAVGPYVAY